MTKGQQAMAVAMVYPEPVTTKRAGSVIITDQGVNPSYLSHARTVLEHAKDITVNVLSGSMSLDAAYKEACDRKDGVDGKVLRLANLGESYPELADKVVEGNLTMPGAEAEATELALKRRGGGKPKLPESP